MGYFFAGLGSGFGGGGLGTGVGCCNDLPPLGFELGVTVGFLR